MATSWVSQVSGPIASHHIYEQNDEIYYEKKPQNKVSKLKTESTQLSLFGKGYFGSFSNRTVSPKDHMMENVKKMREIQRSSRQREEDSKKHRGPIKSTSRTESCMNTPGRKSDNQDVSYSSNTKANDTIKSYASNSNNINHRRAQSASPNIVTKLQIDDFNDFGSLTVDNNKAFLRAHEKTGPPLGLNAYPLTPIRKEVNEAKISVPKASTAREVQLIRRDIDFVRANAYAAKTARLKRYSSADSLMISQNVEKEKKIKKPGEIPSYLIKRRNQWKEDEQLFIQNQPDPDQPPGHRKMPEKERLVTLDLLKATEKDMLTELGRLPIRSDTLKLRTRKQEIEQKLNELEEAIKIFSKPKVFVRIDN